MTLEEIRDALTRVSRVRLPREFRRTGEERTPIRRKIEIIEDHMALCAEARGLAEEARLHSHMATNLLEDEWDEIEGWQQFMPGGKPIKNATQADIVEAKRQVRPDLYTSIREGKRLVARLTEQINRLKQDEETTSRLYTTVSG